jgi:hypothetical protein
MDALGEAEDERSENSRRARVWGDEERKRARAGGIDSEDRRKNHDEHPLHQSEHKGERNFCEQRLGSEAYAGSA